MNPEKKKVLVAKVGLDGHDRGALLVASRLRDAGMEVVYTGLRRNVRQVVNAAVQEDVDVIGLSILSGAHLRTVEKLVACMREEGIGDRMLIVGGVIPDEDVPALKELGVSGVFTQSSTFDEMIDCIRRGG